MLADIGPGLTKFGKTTITSMRKMLSSVVELGPTFVDFWTHTWSIPGQNWPVSVKHWSVSGQIWSLPRRIKSKLFEIGPTENWSNLFFPRDPLAVHDPPYMHMNYNWPTLVDLAPNLGHIDRCRPHFGQTRPRVGQFGGEFDRSWPPN